MWQLFYRLTICRRTHSSVQTKLPCRTDTQSVLTDFMNYTWSQTKPHIKKQHVQIHVCPLAVMRLWVCNNTTHVIDPVLFNLITTTSTSWHIQTQEHMLPSKCEIVVLLDMLQVYDMETVPPTYHHLVSARTWHNLNQGQWITILSSSCTE